MCKAVRKIGITMRVGTPKDYLEYRDQISQDWARFIQEVPGEIYWICLPNIGKGHIERYCEIWGINGLILTGGEDLGVNLIRDETENALLSWAYKKELPAIGICRGMQIMGFRCGVGVKTVQGHLGERHNLNGEFTGEVNSYHGKNLDCCPEGFKVTASSSDGEIEAMRNSEIGWEGWMWHPEREKVFRKEDINRIREIFI